MASEQYFKWDEAACLKCGEYFDLDALRDVLHTDEDVVELECFQCGAKHTASIKMLLKLEEEGDDKEVS